MSSKQKKKKKKKKKTENNAQTSTSHGSKHDDDDDESTFRTLGRGGGAVFRQIACAECSATLPLDAEIRIGYVDVCVCVCVCRCVDVSMCVLISTYACRCVDAWCVGEGIAEVKRGMTMVDRFVENDGRLYVDTAR
jgi:hypothetical protein